VKDFYSKYARGDGPKLETPNSRFVREDAAMLAALQSTKFEDPTMESFRKQAVKNWEEHATRQQGFIERMVDGLFGEDVNILDAEVIPGAR
jgi:predicted DsbA family dithiol-disulfide isomerase